MVFFSLFQEVNTNISLLFVFFWSVFVLSRKNLFRSLERFIIALCKPFVMNFPCFALRYFIFIGVCLFKMSIKILRKCWYSILFISCFNVSLSSSALNSLFWEISIDPIVYYFRFWLRKILLQNCRYKLVEVRESLFKHNAILETSRRVC